MNARELDSRLQSSTSPMLIHVLPPEIYAACHIPGSRNACVYEVAFLEQIRAIAKPSAQVVVYGAGEGSLDAATAAEKLRGAGYSSVEVFEGGIAEWRSAGLRIEGDGELPVPPALDGSFRIDSAQSVVRWTGRNLFNFHSGTVRLAAGEIVLHQGELVSARFTIDLGTIACEDIHDEALNAMLVAHLHSADFFDVVEHPTAEFVTDSAENIDRCTEGTPNYVLHGTFTLRGIQRPLAFPVQCRLAMMATISRRKS